MTARRLLQVALLWVVSFSASALCTNLSFFNPIAGVDWDCIFPITIAGIPIDMGEHPPDDTNDGFFCDCPGHGTFEIGIGFPVSFWEPANLMDTVTDAWCFPAIGANMGNGSTASTSGFGYNGGGMLSQGTGAGDENHAFQHFHYYIFPVWAILGMFLDSACIEDQTSFDVSMVSEIRPDWSDDITAMQLYPETSLMGNEGVVLACIADALAATVQEPLDPLYWCMGAWGITYSMTGNITAKDYVEANAGIAGRALYLQARDGVLPDRATNLCGEVNLPIWVKTHYRFQEIDPIPDNRCHVIGEPGLLWDFHKNPVGMTDNFSWVIFRKVNCCVSIF